jgi:predicted ATPase
MRDLDTDLFGVISGCSSGGKSRLVTELEEPGRRIVKEQMLGNGLALPWVNGIDFARRAITLALVDRVTANGHGDCNDARADAHLSAISDAILTAEAATLLAAKLKTPLQIGQHLVRAL